MFPWSRFVGLLSKVLLNFESVKVSLRYIEAPLSKEFNPYLVLVNFLLKFFSTPFLGPSLFKENKRSVTRAGVSTIMKIFFNEHQGENEEPILDQQDTTEIVCEDALLDAFAGEKK